MKRLLVLFMVCAGMFAFAQTTPTYTQEDMDVANLALATYDKEVKTFFAIAIPVLTIMGGLIVYDAFKEATETPLPYLP